MSLRNRVLSLFSLFLGATGAATEFSLGFWTGSFVTRSFVTRVSQAGFGRELEPRTLSRAAQEGAPDVFKRGNEEDEQGPFTAPDSAPDPAPGVGFLTPWTLSQDALLDVIDDGLWSWNPETGEAQYSARWWAILGYGESDERGDAGRTIQTWLGRVHPQDVARVGALLDEHVAGRTPQFACKYRLRRRDGGYGWVGSRGLARRDENGILRVVGSLTDRSQQGIVDALTGLPNRTLLLDRLGHALGRSRRGESGACAVLFMDLNRFKVINDSLGHQVGDLLLVELAKRLQFCVRGGDTVARLGGDEFVILLETIESAEGLLRILDRIARYTASTFELDGHHVVSSVSIGVVTGLGRYESVEDVLRDADIAMYHAKNAGRPHAFFDPAMYAQAAARQKLEVDLRHALERGEFFLVYQPIISLSNGEINGFEALVRWRHPERGVVGPDAFIPLAEETGLIVPLGEWVLREACAQMSVWQTAPASLLGSVIPVTAPLNAPITPPLFVSVNLATRQLAQDGFVSLVSAILRETGLEPRRLKLEITESAVIDGPAAAAATLSALRALGVGICMDDFGTGYSSLSYIHDLPLDVVKIDRSFVGKMTTDPKGREVVHAVAQLARNLKLDVVCEGVESVEQLALLKGFGCPHVQGYFFSEPLPLEEAKLWAPDRTGAHVWEGR